MTFRPGNKAHEHRSGIRSEDLVRQIEDAERAIRHGMIEAGLLDDPLRPLLEAISLSTRANLNVALTSLDALQQAVDKAKEILDPPRVTASLLSKEVRKSLRDLTLISWVRTAANIGVIWFGTVALVATLIIYANAGMAHTEAAVGTALQQAAGDDASIWLQLIRQNDGNSIAAACSRPGASGPGLNSRRTCGVYLFVDGLEAVPSPPPAWASPESTGQGNIHPGVVRP